VRHHGDRYIVPRRLDDPELIGFWTLDEFAGMIVPFTWGILGQHIFIGILASLEPGSHCGRPKQARSSWVIHAAYWYLPAGLSGLKMTPPSHCRLLAG
jgi:conjugal transfer pilus assembly protein TraL